MKPFCALIILTGCLPIHPATAQGGFSVNILFTASTFDHIFHFHLPYIRALSERGHSVFALGGGVPAQVPYAAESIFLPFKKTVTSAENLETAGQIRRIVKEKQIDRIITHTELASFYVRLAVMGMQNRPQVICVVHGYLFDKHSNRLKYLAYLAAEKYVARVTDVLLTMNQWDYELAQRHRLGDEIIGIPGVGVDFTALRPTQTKEAFRKLLHGQYGVPENAFLILYAAEFSKRKNQKLLIDAMKQLPENVCAILAGDGERKDNCERYAAQLGLDRRIIFPGYIHNMADYYQVADAVVSVSQSEGLPFHIMEAMYFAKPVICSRVKGHADLITDRENGILVRYDDPSAFASAVRELMDDPRRAREMGERARPSVEAYRLESVLPQNLELYLQHDRSALYART